MDIPAGYCTHTPPGVSLNIRTVMKPPTKSARHAPPRPRSHRHHSASPPHAAQAAPSAETQAFALSIRGLERLKVDGHVLVLQSGESCWRAVVRFLPFPAIVIQQVIYLFVLDLLVQAEVVVSIERVEDGIR
jgi:hypothetical protein